MLLYYSEELNFVITVLFLNMYFIFYFKKIAKKWVIILNMFIALVLLLTSSKILLRYKWPFAFTKIINIHSIEFRMKMYITIITYKLQLNYNFKYKIFHFNRQIWFIKYFESILNKFVFEIFKKTYSHLVDFRLTIYKHPRGPRNTG